MWLVIVKLCYFIVFFAKVEVSGSTVEIDPRVVNGVVATNFIPYQASVRVTIRDQIRFGRGHTCGGVLISSRTVTTAAHCLFDGTRLRNAFDLRVVLGSLNRHEFTKDTVIRSVERIIVHPDYVRMGDFSNDIGLIILRSSVRASTLVHAIPIIDHPVESLTNCQISGWGATQWQGSMPSELRKANVSIVPREECNSTTSFGRLIVDGMICANGVNEIGLITDVCQGDSGGPLTCDGKLVGLASFGSRCGFAIELPGVYADVYYFRHWIEENWSGGNELRTSKFLALYIVSVMIIDQFFS